FGQVQVLETPTHLLGRHVLALAEFLLGGTDGLDLQHGNDHAARVGDGTHGGRARAGALTLVVHELLEIFMHATLVGVVVDGDAVVDLGDRTQVLNVGFRGGPPDGVHLFA